MTTDHSALWDRFTSAINNPNEADFDSLVTEDYVEEWPQSGEIMRGRSNFVKMLRSYPGDLTATGLDPESRRIAVQDAKWLMTPAFTLVRLEPTGSVGTVIFRTRYPDGAWWWIIGTYELRDGKLARRTAFFAPEYDPPEWRNGITERTKRA
ncbi:MAG: nuclear transport factor 2 family protein [Chloroflexota bacterium]|nr:nuclear transport factor 2 family protein [Chloroflexota bacterium]